MNAPNLGNFSFGGSDDQLMRNLARYGSVDNYRAALPMPKNVQEMIDSAVVRVGKQRIPLLSRLLALGLGVPVPDWLGILEVTSHKVGESGAAKSSMVPQRVDRGAMAWTPYTVPNYVTWDGFGFNSRELAAARRSGQPLDTSHVSQATVNVNERLEYNLIHGAVTVDGMTSPGLEDTTNTDTFVDGEAWTAASHSGEDIKTDVNGLLETAETAKLYGPFILALPGAYAIKMGDDYKSATSGTIQERILAIPQISEIVVCDFLTADTVLLIAAVPNTVDILVGQMPTAMSYNPDNTGWATEYVVLANVVPRVKSTSEGNFGVVKGTPT